MKKFDEVKKRNGLLYAKKFVTLKRNYGKYAHEQGRIGVFQQVVTVFKKAVLPTETRCIVELQIPWGTLIRTGEYFHNKHRAAEAKVVAIYSDDGRKLSPETEAKSDYDNSFKYVVGKTVRPVKPFNKNAAKTCGAGIHFFFTFEDAKKYYL